MNQVHKENLTHVENANPGRQGLEIEIFGMEGVPAEIIDQHNQQVTQAHFAEEEERARITGNPVRGLYANGQAAPNKRPKINESLEDIEQRAAQFREDRKNGVILPVPEPAQKLTPPVAQSPYGAPLPGAFPAGSVASPFSPSNSAIPARPGSIPGQPGALPPRPGFAGGFPPNGSDPNAISASLDDLIGEVTKEAVPDKKEEKKKSKKENIKLIFFDESTSPEEKMAALPRFAEFARS